MSVTLVESVISGRERRLFFSQNDRGDDVEEQLLEFSERVETAIIIFQVYTIVRILGIRLLDRRHRTCTLFYVQKKAKNF